MPKAKASSGSGAPSVDPLGDVNTGADASAAEPSVDAAADSQESAPLQGEQATNATTSGDDAGVAEEMPVDPAPPTAPPASDSGVVPTPPAPTVAAASPTNLDGEALMRVLPSLMCAHGIRVRLPVLDESGRHQKRQSEDPHAPDADEVLMQDLDPACEHVLAARREGNVVHVVTVDGQEHEVSL